MEGLASRRGRRSGVRAAATVVATLVLVVAPATSARAAVFLVNAFDDSVSDGSCDADCTLRDAVGNADGNTEPDTVNVPSDVTHFIGTGGDIVVTSFRKLTIQGFGGSSPVIDARDSAIQMTADNRIFDFDGGAAVAEIRGLTLTNGNPGAAIDGGAIQNTGDLTLTSTTVSNNYSDENGGGIHNTGALTLTNSDVSSNKSDDNGGGIYSASDPSPAPPAVLTITNSTVNNNNEEPTPSQAGDQGGGIYSRSDGPEPASGADPPGLTITGTTISGNRSADEGGGIYSDGEAAITTSSIKDNVADNDDAGFGPGGGIFTDDPMAIDSSTISGNTSGEDDGGGIYNGSDLLTLVNTTISGNRAGSGSGVADEVGGGLRNGGTARLTNVTLADNQADGDGGGTWSFPLPAVSTIFKNTIVSGNRAPGPGPNCQGSAQHTSNGHNLESANTCGFASTGDQPSTDPRLGPLQDNGSPFTHALLAGSPAIDTADSAACPPTDERGVARPQGAGCDIGAFEASPAAPPGGPSPGGPPAPGPEPLIVGGCLNAQGGVTGRSLGPVRLGRTRRAQRAILKGARLRSRKGLDRYCAVGGGAFRIGYPSARLNRTLRPGIRRRLRNRVVLILTSSRRFTVNRIRPGASVRTVRRRFRGGRRVRVGKNVWYLTKRGPNRLLVTTQRGRVRAVGIGDPRLSRTRKATKNYLRAWELAR